MTQTPKNRDEALQDCETLLKRLDSMLEEVPRHAGETSRPESEPAAEPLRPIALAHSLERLESLAQLSRVGEFAEEESYWAGIDVAIRDVRKAMSSLCKEVDGSNGLVQQLVETRDQLQEISPNETGEDPRDRLDRYHSLLREGSDRWNELRELLGTSEFHQWLRTQASARWRELRQTKGLSGIRMLSWNCLLAAAVAVAGYVVGLATKIRGTNLVEVLSHSAADMSFWVGTGLAASFFGYVVFLATCVLPVQQRTRRLSLALERIKDSIVVGGQEIPPRNAFQLGANQVGTYRARELKWLLATLVLLPLLGTSALTGYQTPKVVVLVDLGNGCEKVSGLSISESRRELTLMNERDFLVVPSEQILLVGHGYPLPDCPSRDKDEAKSISENSQAGITVVLPDSAKSSALDSAEVVAQLRRLEQSIANLSNALVTGGPTEIVVPAGAIEVQASVSLETLRKELSNVADILRDSHAELAKLSDLSRKAQCLELEMFIKKRSRLIFRTFTSKQAGRLMDHLAEACLAEAEPLGAAP